MAKTIAFLGASNGVGHFALKSSLAAGHRCIALCRVPSKLTTIFPPATTPNLQVIEGNAHDVAAVSRCLQWNGDGKLVDMVISTIGGKPVMNKMMTDDPNVCRKGMAVLLESLTQLRSSGVSGQPCVVVCSTTGMSKFGRDTPLAMIPLYSVILKTPHQDKTIMEESLAGSGEDFTIVRCSMLLGGESSKKIRVGIEDPKSGRESNAIGYTISKEDAGRWIAENLVFKRDGKFVKKIATITY